MRILVLLIFVLQIMFSSLAQAADLRFDPDNDGTDNVVIHEDSSMTVGEYTLPANDGTTDQVLSTDGAGNVTWKDALVNNVTNLWTETAGRLFRNSKVVVGSEQDIASDAKFAVQGSAIVGDVTKSVTDQSSVVALPALKAHFKMNDDAASTVVVDETGNYNGTALNMTNTNTVTGAIGSALQFGENQSVSIPNVDANEFTFSVRVKRNAISDPDGDGIILSVDNGGWGVGFKPTNHISLTKVGYSSITSDATVTNTSDFVLITVVFNNGTVSFYINGVLDSTKDYNVTFSCGSNYTIGSRGNSGSLVGWFDGIIDDFRIYPVALTQEQVSLLYNYTPEDNDVFMGGNNLATTTAFTSTDYHSKNIGLQDSNVSNVAIEGKLETLGKTYHENDVYVNGNLNVTGQVSFDQGSTITIGDYTMPSTDGGADQVLATDGAGNLVWVDQEDITSGAYALPTVDGNAGQMLVTDGAGNLTWQDVPNAFGDYTLPAADGTAEQVLATDGAGNLSWKDVVVNNVTSFWTETAGRLFRNSKVVVGSDQDIASTAKLGVQGSAVIGDVTKEVTDNGASRVEFAGQVLHLKFNDKATDATIVDSSSNAHPFTMSGSTANSSTGPGKVNDSLAFTSSTHVVGPHLASAPSRSEALSISFWFKTTAPKIEHQIINMFAYGDERDRRTGKFNMALRYYGPGGHDVLHLSNGTETTCWELPEVRDGQWHHLVFNYGEGWNANSAKVYLDNVEYGNMGGLFNNHYNYPLNTSPNPYKIYFAKTYSGSLDEFRMFNRLLTDVEREALWSGGNGTEEDIVYVDAKALITTTALTNSDYRSDYIKITDDQASNLAVEGIFENKGKTYHGDDVTIDGDLVVKGQVNFDNNNDGTPDVIVNPDGTLTVGDYTMPASDGAADQVLATDGSGNLVWVDQEDITAGAYTLPTVDGTTGQILETDGAGNLTWTDKIVNSVSSLWTETAGRLFRNSKVVVGSDQDVVSKAIMGVQGDVVAGDITKTFKDGVYDAVYSGITSAGDLLSEDFETLDGWTVAEGQSLHVENGITSVKTSIDTAPADTETISAVEYEFADIIDRYKLVHVTTRFKVTKYPSDNGDPTKKGGYYFYFSSGPIQVWLYAYEDGLYSIGSNTGINKYVGPLELNEYHTIDLELDISEAQYGSTTKIYVDGQYMCTVPDSAATVYGSYPAVRTGVITRTGDSVEAFTDYLIVGHNTVANGDDLRLNSTSGVTYNNYRSEYVELADSTKANFIAEGKIEAGTGLYTPGELKVSGNATIKGNVLVGGNFNFDNNNDGIPDIVIGDNGTISIGDYTLPATDGGVDQVLATDGNGNLVWIDQHDITSGSYTLPTVDGTDGQILVTDGAGNVSWQDVESGSTAGSDIVVTTLTSAAIQAAIDLLGANGGTVKLLPATYVVNSPILVPANVSLIGSGKRSTILDASAYSADRIIQIQGRNVKLANFSMLGFAGGGNPNSLIYNDAAYDPQGLVIDSLYLDGSDYYGIEFAYRTGHRGVVIKNTDVVNSDMSAVLYSLGGGDLLFDNNRILDSGQHGLYMNNSGPNVKILNSYFESTLSHTYYSIIKTPTNSLIDNTVVYARNTRGVAVTGENVRITNSSFSSNITVFVGSGNETHLINTHFNGANTGGIGVYLGGDRHLVENCIIGKARFDTAILLDAASTGNTFKNNYIRGLTAIDTATAVGNNIFIDNEILGTVTDQNSTIVTKTFDETGLQLGDYKLPLNDGSAEQTLVTDGSGNLSWKNLTSSIFSGIRYLVGGVKKTFKSVGNTDTFSDVPSSTNLTNWTKVQGGGTVVYDDSQGVDAYKFETTTNNLNVKAYLKRSDLALDNIYVAEMTVKVSDKTWYRYPALRYDNSLLLDISNGSHLLRARISAKAGNNGIYFNTGEDVVGPMVAIDQIPVDTFFTIKFVVDATNPSTATADVYIDGTLVAENAACNYESTIAQQVLVGIHSYQNVQTAYMSDFKVYGPDAPETNASAIAQSEEIYSKFATDQKSLIIEGGLDVKNAGPDTINNFEGQTNFTNNVNVAGNLIVNGQVNFDNNNDGTPDVVVNPDGTLTVGDYTLPATDGGANQVLATDGAGNLVWVDQEDVTAGAYSLPTVDGNVGQILVTDGAGNITWQEQTDDFSGLFHDDVNNVVKTDNKDVTDTGSGTVDWSAHQVLSLNFNEDAASIVDPISGNVMNMYSNNLTPSNFEFLQNKNSANGQMTKANFNDFGSDSFCISIMGRMPDALNGTTGRFFFNNAYNSPSGLSLYVDESELLVLALRNDQGDSLSFRCSESLMPFQGKNVGIFVLVDRGNSLLKFYVAVLEDNDLNPRQLGVDIDISGVTGNIIGSPVYCHNMNSTWANKLYFEFDQMRWFKNHVLTEYEMNAIWNGGRGTEQDSATVESINLQNGFAVMDGTNNINSDFIVSGDKGWLAVAGKSHLMGDVQIDGGLNVSGQINFDNNNDGTPDVIVNQDGTLTVGDYTMPANDGAADQVLATDGNGNLVWVDQEDVTAGAYTLPTVDGNAGQMLVTDGSGNVTWVDASTLTVAGIDGQIQFNQGGELGASDLAYDESNKILKTALVAVTDGASADAWNLNPTHHWKLNETSGTMVEDSVGGLNGTLTEDASVLSRAGWISNVYDFDKSTGYISLAGTPLTSTDTFYIAIDFSDLSGEGPFFSESSSTETYMYNYLGLSKGRLYATSATAINRYFQQFSSKQLYNDGQRHTAVWMYDGVNYRFIIDGGEDNGGETIVYKSSKWTPTTDSISIGKIVRPQSPFASRAKIEQVLFGEAIPSDADIARWHNQVTEDTSKGYGFIDLSKGFASLTNNSDYNSPNLKSVDEGWIIAEGNAEVGNNLFVENDAHIKGNLNVTGQVNFDHGSIITIGDYTMPATDGGADQVLATDGNGNLVWVDQEDLTAGAYALPTVDGTDGQILVTDGAGNVTWVDQKELSESIVYDSNNNVFKTSESAVVDKGFADVDLSVHNVLHVKANDNFNDNVIVDSSSFNNNGTLRGGDNTSDLSVQGKLNTSIVLDGVNDHITFPDVEAYGSTNLSVSMWVYVDQLLGNRQFASKWDFGVNEREWFIGTDSTDPTKLTFGMSTTGSDYTLVTSTTSVLSENTWIHIVVNYNSGGGVDLYVDNQPISFTGSPAATLHDGSSDIQINGIANGGSNYYFAGKVDDLRVFSEILNVDEISFLYNSGAGTENTVAIDGNLPLQNCFAVTTTDLISPNINSSNDDGSLLVENNVEIGNDLFVLKNANINGDLNVSGQVNFDNNNDGTPDVIVNQDGTLTVGDYTLPATDGGADQVLATDGNGNLVWVDQEDVTAGAYTLPTVDGNAGQMLVTDGAGNVTWADVDKSELLGDRFLIGGVEQVVESTGTFSYLSTCDNESGPEADGWTIHKSSGEAIHMVDGLENVYRIYTYATNNRYTALVKDIGLDGSFVMDLNLKFDGASLIRNGLYLDYSETLKYLSNSGSSYFGAVVNGKAVVVFVGENGVNVGNSDVGAATNISSNNYVDGQYHDFRIMYDDTYKTIDVFVDGAEIASNVSIVFEHSTDKDGTIFVGSSGGNSTVTTTYLNSISIVAPDGIERTSSAIGTSNVLYSNYAKNNNDLVVEGQIDIQGSADNRFRGNVILEKNLDVAGNLNVTGQVNFDNNNDGTPDVIVNPNGTLTVGDYTLPATDGGADQVLATDGNGNLVWVDQEDITAGAYTLPAIDGTAGQVLSTDGNGNVTWVDDKTGDGSGLVGTTGGDYIKITDTKPSGTVGGTFSANSWQTRDLNSIDVDTGNNSSIDNNIITLQPGTYEFDISAPAVNVERHQARLYNITDSLVVSVGTTAYASSSNGEFSRSFIKGRFTIDSAKDFAVQHYCKITKENNGFGQASQITDEVYTVVEFRKIGSDSGNVVVADSEYVKISDVKSSGTDGGYVTQATWQTRDINTEDSDSGNNCIIDSNNITLNAGTYTFRIEAPAVAVNKHRARLFNTTDNVEVAISASAWAGKSYEVYGNFPAVITGEFTINEPKSFVIQHYAEENSWGNALGQAANLDGRDEVYTVAEFWKQGSVSDGSGDNGSVEGSNVPAGGIIMWSGAVDAVPEGWALCDGANGTPDLRNRFIVGAGDQYTVDATGGEDQHTLTTDEMPSHTHSVPFGWVNTDNGGTGSTPLIRGEDTNTVEKYYSSGAGGNQPHENRPPYYALAYIMKL